MEGKALAKHYSLTKLGIAKNLFPLLVLLIGVGVIGVGAISVQADEMRYLAQKGAPPTVDNVSAALSIVTHVDVLPQFTASATKLLEKYRQDSLKDAGVKRVDILQQVGRPNHYTIVEEWENQRAYDAHVSAAGTLEFRNNLQSMLGAPFDERPHHALN